MKEKNKQTTTSKKSSHNTLGWVEQQLMEVRAFDMGISLNHKKRERSGLIMKKSF